MAKPEDTRSQRTADLIAQASQALQRGDPARAMLIVHQALALRPREPKCHQLLGQIYQHMGKDLLARKALSTAQALDPGAVTNEQSPAAALTATSRSVPSPPPATAGTAARLATAAGAQALAPASAPDLRRLKLTTVQRKALLNQAIHYLAEVVSTQKFLEEKGLTDTEAYNIVSQGQQDLTRYIHAGRAALRAEQQPSPRPAPAASPLPAGPAGITPAYRAIPPFTHTLGPIAGAVTRGPEVENLQKLLSLEGLKVTVSGQYDKSTALAVRKLQEKYGMKKQDGIVGGDTRRLLNHLTGQGA